MIIKFDELKIFRTLCKVAATVVLLNIIDLVVGEPSWQITRLINLGLESNFSTWFSSVLLLFAAVLSWKCLTLETDPKGRKVWGVVAAVFLLMSCDEVAMMHENWGKCFNKYLFPMQNFRTEWVITLGPIAVFILIFIAIRLYPYIKISKQSFKYLLWGLVIFIGGSLFVESSMDFLNYIESDLFWKIEVILEESMEIGGVLLMIYGLISLCAFLFESRTY